MKFQKTVLASLIFVATTAAWAQTGGASQPASQPASNPNENLSDRAVTWPELDKVLNGDPNSNDEAQKLGVWGAVVQGFGDIDKEVSDLKKNTFKAFQELVVAANNDNDAQDEEIAKKANQADVEAFAESVKSSLNLLSDSVNNVLHGDTTAAEGSDERKGVIGILNEKADKTELDKKANKAEFDNFKEETVANVENVGTIALGAEAAVNDLLDALYGKEGTDESGQLGEMYNAINEKADKTSLDVVKKQVANVAITTYKLDKQIADLAEQAGEAVETLNDNMLDLASTTVAMIAELAQSAEDDNQAQNAEIAKKADKVVVDDLIAKHNAAGEELGRFVNHVNDGFEKVGENLNTLAEKHDKAGEELARFVNHVNDGFEKVGENLNTLAEKHDKAGEELARFVNHVNDGFEKVGENLNTLAAEKADKTEVEAVDAKVETLATNAQTAVDTLAQATRDLAIATDRELTGLKDKNTEMSGKLEATEVRVTNVEAAVRNLGTTQISALDARITANSDRINGLNTRVNQLSKELKRGMASQAALSGLFQPYNVGKVNITAAVGGYKSATAVAIGAGYRVNNKFAAKAGVAFSAGSPAYNVGINYEF